ncbi:MAG: 6,7-dimethyl-8-ribityllumazine synthase [Nitratireductor sp.]
MASALHLLIVEARFYEDIADELLSGAVNALDSAGATHDRISVPGALEIPAAIAMALYASEDNGVEYDGFVALGVSFAAKPAIMTSWRARSARALMDLAIDECIAVGNGIITCENGEQAWPALVSTEKNKGGGAAEAALEMIRVRRKLGA